MSPDRVPFLDRQRGPRRLLAVPAAKPSVAILAVRARILVDQKEAVTANDTADLAHQGQLRWSDEVMERKTDPHDIYGLGPTSQRLDEIPLVEQDGTAERWKSVAVFPPT